jgi:hypothetical protein
MKVPRRDTRGPKELSLRMTYDFPPFVVAQCLAAALIGAVAGAHEGLGMALLGAGLMFVGSVFSAVISGMIFLGEDVAGWKQVTVAIFGNPLVMLALLVMALGWKCVVGLEHDLGCLPTLIAELVAFLCLLPPFVGLLWRWWKCRRLPHNLGK